MIAEDYSDDNISDDSVKDVDYHPNLNLSDYNSSENEILQHFGKSMVILLGIFESGWYSYYENTKQIFIDDKKEDNKRGCILLNFTGMITYLTRLGKPPRIKALVSF